MYSVCECAPDLDLLMILYDPRLSDLRIGSPYSLSIQLELGNSITRTTS